MTLTLLGALVGGTLTLLSPCSAMLLPAFFSYAFASPGRLLARTGVFYLGLVSTLVPIGVLAGSFGAFVNDNRSTVVSTASWVVIGLGVLMVAGVRIPLPGTFEGAQDDVTSTASVYALGTIYGLAGVCAGPLLGAVLTMAAVGASAVYGGLVLLVFAAGMVLPLVVLAGFWDRSRWPRRLARPRGVTIGRWSNTWTGIVGGALTAVAGILLLLTDGTSSLGGALTTEDQSRLEQWVARQTDGVSNLAFAVAAVGVLAAGVTWRRYRLRRPARARHDGRRWSPEPEANPQVGGSR